MSTSKAIQKKFTMTEYYNAKNRLGRDRYMNDTERQQDLAIVEQGREELARKADEKPTLERVQQAVMNYYMPLAANLKITEVDMLALAELAFHLDLNPLPSMGEVYLGVIKGQKVMLIGYAGKLKIVQRTKQITITASRPMYPEEYLHWGINPKKQIGGICEIVDIGASKILVQLGMKPATITGVGVVDLETWSNKDNKMVPTQAMQGRPLSATAVKRAMTDALNKLRGESLPLPEIGGYVIDPITNAYVAGASVPDGELFDPNAEVEFENGEFVTTESSGGDSLQDKDWVFDVTDIVREGNSYSFFDNDMFIATFQEADLNGHILIETMSKKPAIRNNMLLTVHTGDFVGDDEQDPRAYLMSFVGLKSK